MTKRLFKEDELDGRLNCFGDFDPQDTICMRYCALNISCAVAKGRYLNLPFVEEDFYASYPLVYE